MIKLADILNIDNKEYDKYKIHFAIGTDGNKGEPLLEFQKGTFKGWQESQTQKNFEQDFILSLIYYKDDQWLFAGVYESNGCKKVGEKYIYSTILTDVQADFIGRIIIDFNKRKIRNAYLLGENYLDKLVVRNILEKPVMVQEFPGYSNINICFEELKIIVEKQEATWKNALSIMKGVYLILDKSNGKHYVGSATGAEAIWSRWSDYIKDGHGSNKELKNVITKKGIAHANNFKFSILEIAGLQSDDNFILAREAFWKKVLLSKEFGYNAN